MKGGGSGATINVAILIVNYCTPLLVGDALAALERQRAVNVLKVTVVDGGSGDGSAEYINSIIAQRDYADWVTLISAPINGGFGWANNEGFRDLLRREDAPHYIVLLNPDAITQSRTLESLVAVIELEPRAAAVGSLLLDEESRRQGSAFLSPSIKREFFRGASIAALERLSGTPPLVVESDETVEVDWVTGAAVMFRTEALREVGLFDEGFFLYFEEVELMHRMRKAGWKILHVPSSRVRHIGGASTGIADGSSAQKRLPRYWFESRRRYFALTHGRFYALLASLAWLAGNLIWQLRCALGFGRASSHAPHEARDLLRYGIWPSKRDATPAVPSWDSPTGQLPAWMRDD